ncbi:MAG: GIY-YIG nuclease family protein [Flavisolibacter sp.]
MFFTYILYSEKRDRHYIGYCQDLRLRLDRHTSGMVNATKNCRPYIIKASKLQSA